jgi:peptidoglycan-N-acetylglucosamine deacetylase
LYQDLEWRIPVSGPELFLTFDDGPIPEVTPEVLRILDQFNAKATFFCIGDNVRKHPEIYRSILEKGHRTGNHTYHHLNGWKTPLYTYLRNTQECAGQVKSDLFRPPYGRITRAQARALRKRYRIIMWDVLSKDYDPSVSYDKCLRNVTENSKAGSVIVLHDSLKASEKMLYVLPRILDHFSEQKYFFRPIT